MARIGLAKFGNVFEGRYLCGKVVRVVVDAYTLFILQILIVNMILQVLLRCRCDIVIRSRRVTR